MDPKFEMRAVMEVNEFDQQTGNINQAQYQGTLPINMNSNFNYQYHKKKILTNENTNRYSNLSWAK